MKEKKNNKTPAMPQKEWQIDVNLTPEGDNSGAGALLPRGGKNRPTTHVKTNECDY